MPVGPRARRWSRPWAFRSLAAWTPRPGVVVEKGHDLEGQSIAGKVLVFSTGKGSTVGSYTLYRLKFNGRAPAAIVNRECETIVAVGCIIAEIPCVDQIAIGPAPHRDAREGGWRAGDRGNCGGQR